MSQEYLKELNKEFKHPIIEILKEQAIQHHVPIITDEGIHFIVQILNIHQSKKVLEIGTAIGYSSILMALFSHADITSIERNQAWLNIARANIDKANLNQRISIIEDDANNVDLDETFDMVFIDAAKSSYINFFKKFSKNLKKGGLIITDNLLFRGQVAHPDQIESKNRRQLVKKINKYNEFLVNQENFDTYIYAIGDGISLSIKK